MRWKIAQAAEIRWWKRYLQKQDKATYLKNKGAYWHRLLEECAFKIPENAKILDAGCGPAGVFMILSDFQVTAVDPLLGRYQNELQHFSEEWYPWVSFRSLPLEDLQETAAFDLVFCLNVINHVRDIQGSLEALYDALKPGGQLLLSVDVHNYSFFRYLFGAIPGDILHPHQYYLKEYISFAGQAGFEWQETHHLKSAFFFDYYGILLKK